MNREDIIRMARACFDVHTDERGRETFSGDHFCVEELVALVTKAEREECARIAKSYGGPEKPAMVGTYEAGWFNAAEAIAADIRARKNEDQRPCTCHPIDNPPKPCPRRYALSECRDAAIRARGQA